MATNKRDLKAFIRLDGSLRTVPSSLILRKKKPKVGKWVEVTAYECCYPGLTSTTTTAYPECVTYGITIIRGSAVLSYTDCGGQPVGPFELNSPVDDTFCAIPGSISLEGDGTITLLYYGCETTTTTTTTA